MTRVPHLYRLAFGRGAFEPLEASGTEENPDEELTDQPRYIQRYDERGYPRNAGTEGNRNTQVAAMNEVLAAVGVCEKKNEEDRLARGKTFSPQEWRLIQDAENDHAELVHIVAARTRHICTWWIVSLRKRIQAGFIPSSISFVNVLQQEWHTFLTAGFATSMRPFVLGSITQFATNTTIILFQLYTHEVHYWLENYIIRSNLSHSWTESLLNCADYLCGGFTHLAPIIFSPLIFYTNLIQLGLTTSIPATALLPWHPTSPLQWGLLNRTAPFSTASILASPMPYYIALILARTILIPSWSAQPTRPRSKDDNLFLPSTRQEPPQPPPQPATTPPLPPFPTIRLLRNHLFNAVISYPSLEKEERLEQGQPRTQRTTDLARLPTETLSTAFDTISLTLIFIPLESLFLRALASSYALSQPFPSPGTTIRAAVGYAPGGGPLGRLLAAGVGGRNGEMQMRAALGEYVSSLGLCVVVQTIVEVGVWMGGVWWTRLVGREWFYWGVA